MNKFLEFSKSPPPGDYHMLLIAAETSFFSNSAPYWVFGILSLSESETTSAGGPS